MRIVIDTNVLVSGVFFGGFPRKILTSVVGQKITACATAEIVNEPITHVEICRDPDDNKIAQQIIDIVVLTKECYDDCQHIGTAIANECDCIIS